MERDEEVPSAAGPTDAKPPRWIGTRSLPLSIALASVWGFVAFSALATAPPWPWYRVLQLVLALLLVVLYVASAVYLLTHRVRRSRDS